MNITALDIPQDDAQLAKWLERQLVGCDLGDLVAGLLAVGGRAEIPMLDSLLEGRVGAVLQSGLGVLSPSKLRELIGNPISLMELQERVFVQGGAYWDEVPRAAEHLDAARRVATRVAERHADEMSSPVLAPTAPSRRAWMACAIAASLLLGLGVWRISSSTPSPGTHKGWGFDRPGVLAQELSAPDYLLMLAAAAGEWSNKTPQTREELHLRLQQFVRGCDTLLAAEHLQLSADDRTWLLGRCRVWRSQLARMIAALNAGKSVSEIRSDANEQVRSMAESLRDRAESIG